MSKVCWLSIDPVRRKVDFYPRSIALRIEESYNHRDSMSLSRCILGNDFFNATIHFHQSGSCYQTTPGMSMGRAGFKQPGYRSVKRIVKDPSSSQITIYSKQVHGEWRIASNYDDYEIRFDETIPQDCIVEGSAGLTDNVYNRFDPWSGADLTSGAFDASVVVWQWCRGVPERQGNLMALSDEWWCPYLQNQNSIIESAFSEHRDNAEIEIQDHGTYTICFNNDNSFASQRDSSRTKHRLVRRVIKTIQELKIMIDRMGCPPLDIDEIISQLPDDTTPHHFFCAITQGIMVDPVKTIDGHTYDRPAIERWFQDHNTSPLTGLPLVSKTLVPNTIVRNQIEKFIKEHTEPQPPEQNLTQNVTIS